MERTWDDGGVRGWGPPGKEILRSMLAQRVELGLTRDPVRAFRTPIVFVPVVACGQFGIELSVAPV